MYAGQGEQSVLRHAKPKDEGFKVRREYVTTRNLGGKSKRNGYYFHHDIAYSLSITSQLSPDLRDPFTESRRK
jgi:hypothetical protein